MKTITVELPDIIQISGAKDAPQDLRVLNTKLWDSEFCFSALLHGISQKIGDTWSVGKKDISKLKAVHTTLEAGEWNQRQRGVGEAKFDEAIKKLNDEQIIAKLSPERLLEIAAKIAADKK